MKDQYNKLVQALAVPVLALGALVANAAVDADITAMQTDATSIFSGNKTIIISVVGFGIAIGYIGMLRRRR